MPFCPKCGHRLDDVNATVSGGVQTIELRSKKLKGRQIAFFIIMIAGTITTCVGLLPVGIPLVAIGVLGVIYTRIMMWWNHS
jgi:uncharacterized membrane protein